MVNRLAIEPPALSFVRKLVRRMLFLLAYFGWVKHTMSRRVTTRVLGFSMVVPPTVFHPRYYFTSKFLGEYLMRLPLRGKKLLDAGSGSGILSLASASAGAIVTSVDINPAAVDATIENARRNGLAGRILALQMDLTANPHIGSSGFDLIVSNPPYYGGEAQTMAEKAFRRGRTSDFFESLAGLLPDLLLPGGAAILVLSSDVDIDACLQPFEAKQFQPHVVRTKALPFETLTLIELHRI
jgi:release factor glutamine methyltransferase